MRCKTVGRVLTPVLPSFHDLSSAHKRVLPPIVDKFCLLFFTRGVGMRLVMNCPASRQDIGPFEDLSVLTKFALVQQVVRTCFCDCVTKCIARATRTNQKTTAFCFPELLDKFLVSKNVFALLFCNK